MPAAAPVDLARVVLRSVAAAVLTEVALSVLMHPFLGGPDLRWLVVHGLGSGAGVGLAFAVADGLARTLGGRGGGVAGLLAGALLAPLALLGAFFAAALLITGRSDQATASALEWAGTVPRGSALALVSAGVCTLAPLLALRSRGALAQALAVSTGAALWAGAALVASPLDDLAAASLGGYLLLVLARGPLFVLGLALTDRAYARLRGRDLGVERARTRDLALLLLLLAGLVALAHVPPIEAARTTFARMGAALGRPASQVALADRLGPPSPTYFGTTSAWFGPTDVALRAAVALRSPARLPEIAMAPGDEALALGLYRAAAAQGSGLALRRLALGREAGWPIEEDAVALFRRAADAGDTESLRILAGRLLPFERGLWVRPYHRREPTPAERAEALGLLRRGVAMGDASLGIDLAFQLDDGAEATDEALPLLRALLTDEGEAGTTAAELLSMRLLLHPDRATPRDRELLALRAPARPLGGLAQLRPWLDVVLEPWLDPGVGSEASRRAASALAGGRLEEAQALAAVAVLEPAEGTAGRLAARDVLALVVLRRAHDRQALSPREVVAALDALCADAQEPAVGVRQAQQDAGEIVELLMLAHCVDRGAWMKISKLTSALRRIADGAGPHARYAELRDDIIAALAADGLSLR